MSQQTSQKPNCPFQGNLGCGTSSSASGHSMEVDFGDLQLAIDSKQWKKDGSFLSWIWEEYSHLIGEKKVPPHNFGSEEFWARILGDDESQDANVAPAPTMAEDDDDAYDQAWQQGEKNLIMLHILETDS